MKKPMQFFVKTSLCVFFSFMAISFLFNQGCKVDLVVIDPDTLNVDLTITRPNGGESFTTGAKEQITWKSSGDIIDKVKLEYWNGSSWNSIIEETDNSGNYQWQIPQDTSTQAKVRITDPLSGNDDESDNTFKIIAPADTTNDK